MNPLSGGNLGPLGPMGGPFGNNMNPLGGGNLGPLGPMTGPSGITGPFGPNGQPMFGPEGRNDL